LDYLCTENVSYFLSTIINHLLSPLHCEQNTFFTRSTDGEYVRSPSRLLSLTSNLWKRVLLFLTKINY